MIELMDPKHLQRSSSSVPNLKLRSMLIRLNRISKLLRLTNIFQRQLMKLQPAQIVRPTNIKDRGRT